jgi:uncharacterized membrane protein YfhO
MVWSEFKYLGIVGALALIAALFAYKRYPKLSTASYRRTKDELIFIAIISIIGLATIYWRLYTQRVGFCFGPGDTGTDTIEQYVPFYTNLIENIRNGSFDIWSFEYGLGVNLPSYQTWLYDPFNLLLIPFALLLGAGRLSLALVLTQSARIVISAFLFDHLLTRYSESPLARAAASILYAFSSYLLLLGQNFFLGSMLPMLTLVVLCYELYLETQSVPAFLRVTASITVTLLWSAYISFMVLLFAAIYLLLRIFATKKGDAATGIAITILKMALPVVCGVLLSGVLLIPYAHFLLQETSRTSSDVTMTDKVIGSLGFVNIDWVPAILSRLLGGSLLNNGSNTTAAIVSDMGEVGYTGSFPYEFIQLGFSCGVLLLLSQFFHWAVTELDLRGKVLVGVSTVLVLLFCFGQFLPTLFTAMVRFQYRSSGVLGIPICIALALALEKRVLPGKVAIVPLAGSFVVSIAALVWSLLHAASGRLPSAVFGIMLVSSFACIVVALRIKEVERALNVAFLGIIVASAFFDGFYCTNNRNLLPIESFPHSFAAPADANTEAALDYVRGLDDDMYRVDKTYCDHFLASDSWIEHYDGASAYNSTLDADLLDFYDQLWPEAECSWAYYTQMYFNDPAPDVNVLNLIGLRYVFSYDEQPHEWAEFVQKVGPVNVYRVCGSEGFASVRGNVIGESKADAMADAESRRQVLKDAVIVPDEVAERVSGLGASSSSVSMRKLSEHELVGDFDLENEGVVCVPVPYTGTWEVAIDGQSTETFRADYGFVGFLAPVGSHSITVIYHTEGQNLGLALSFAGIAITALCCVLLGRQGKKLRELGEN